jgi:hypothetical protein
VGSAGASNGTTAVVTNDSTALATTAFVHNILPYGTIIMWHSSSGTIPTGWALCNGGNGTPDLRNRFIVGAGNAYAVGATGGSTDAVIVSHNHSVNKTLTDPGHFHFSRDNNGPSGLRGMSQSDGDNGLTWPTTAAYTGITLDISNNATGESGNNKNLPPYYALCYIMKTTGA